MRMRALAGVAVFLGVVALATASGVARIAWTVSESTEKTLAAAGADAPSTARQASPNAIPATDSTVPTAETKLLTSSLPDDGFADKFKRAEVKFYTPADLFEYIDGQAEGYIAYNFQALASATFKAGANAVVIDVYDMEKPIQAFGLYSTFRAPTNEFVAIGGQGFTSEEGVMLWKGRMVVRVSTEFATEGEGAQGTQTIAAVALAAAKATAAKIADEKRSLEILAILPEEGKTKDSDKYVLHALLGQSFLENGVTAEYPLGTGVARLFVCDFGKPEAAAKAYGEYLKFATAHGKVTETQGGKEGVGQAKTAQGKVPQGLSSKEFKGEIKYYGMTDVFLNGRFLAGGVNLPAGSEQLVEKLKKSVNSASAK